MEFHFIVSSILCWFPHGKWFLFPKVLLRNRAEENGWSWPPRPSFLWPTLSTYTSTWEDEGERYFLPIRLDLNILDISVGTKWAWCFTVPYGKNLGLGWGRSIYCFVLFAKDVRTN